MPLVFIRSHIRIWACLLISLIGLFLRFRLYWNKPFWNDETYQLAQTQGAFKPFWKWNFYGDFTVFPGDYLLTYPFIRFFPEWEWGLRIPHVIATFALFILFYFLCCRHLKSIGGFIVAFLILAFNATLINHSFEFRPYAVLPVLAVGTLLFMEYLVDDSRQRNFWSDFGGVLFLIFVTMFHAYGFYMIFFSVLLIFFTQLDRQSFKELLLQRGKYIVRVIVVCGLIWLWYAIGSKVTFKISPDRFAGTDIHPFRYIPHPLLEPVGFAKGVIGNLTGNKYLYVFLLGLVGIFMGGKERVRYQVRFLMCLIIIPLFLMLTLTLMGGYYFLQRQFIWVMPLWALFLAQQWDYFFARISFRQNTP